jgi:peptidoglycan/xylan/chitin deacetylase (PgdA/CDA1 family)
MKYISKEEAAKKWDVPAEYVEVLCEDGKIEGAVDVQGEWSIPEDTKNPRGNNKKIKTNKKTPIIIFNMRKLAIVSLAIIAVVALSFGVYNFISRVNKQSDIESVTTDSAASEAAASNAESTGFPVEGTVKVEDSAEVMQHGPLPKDQVQHPYQEKYPELYCNTPVKTVNKEKTVYLTFDDGPSDRTPEVLDILKSEGVKATFFVIGKEAAKRKDLLNRIVREGHTLGIHTYTHDYNQIYSSVDAYLDDFAETYDLIVDTTGIRPTMFRFPGGSVNAYNKDVRQELIAEMNRRGFVHYDWNCSSGDGGNSIKSASQEVNNVITTLSTNGETIVLMHDAQAKKLTVAALDDIIKGIRNKGYNMESLSNNVEVISFYLRGKQ